MNKEYKSLKISTEVEDGVVMIELSVGRGYGSSESVTFPSHQANMIIELIKEAKEALTLPKEAPRGIDG